MLFIKMLLKRLLVLIVLYQLCRLVFLAFNFQYFNTLSFGGFLNILRGSLLFDLSTIAYSNVLYIALFILPFNFRFNKTYQKVAAGTFIVVNTICLASNLIDAAYFPFILHRTNGAFFLEFKNDTNLLGDLGKFIYSYWYITILVGILGWLVYKSYSLIKMPERSEQTRNKIIWDVVAIPLMVVLWLGAARGSFVFKTRPLAIINAGDYTSMPAEINLVINTPFSILSTIGNIKVPEVNYYPSLAEAEEYYNPVQHFTRAKNNTGKNVVVIVVESLSREFVGALNDKTGDYKGYTPFLDSLIGNSLAFKYCFATGRRSIEALPSVVASIPSHTEAYTITPYTGNTINSLSSVLKKHGYQTSFFHGAHEGSMGFEAFMRMAGTEQGYSKEDYNNDADFDGTWGIWDEEFLQYWAQQLDTFRQPFVSTLFTVSSHHPYALPERYKGKFDEGNLEIHHSIQYTDMALRNFFETASKMPWYKNTIFVITADHAATYAHYPQYQNSMGSFAVPIVFFTPDSSLKGFRHDLVQQSDIFPTVIDYLGLNDSIVAFGNSILNDTAAHLVVNCFSGTYQALYKDMMLQFDGQKAIGLYKFKEDMKMEHNLLGQYPAEEKQITAMLKAYIQQYSTRVRNNKMLP